MGTRKHRSSARSAGARKTIAFRPRSLELVARLEAVRILRGDAHLSDTVRTAVEQFVDAELSEDAA